jgi:hypothetical protein
MYELRYGAAYTVLGFSYGQVGTYPGTQMRQERLAQFDTAVWLSLT